MRPKPIVPTFLHSAISSRHRVLAFSLATVAAFVVATAAPASAMKTTVASAKSNGSAVFTTLEVRAPHFAGSAPLYVLVQAEPLGAASKVSPPILVHATRVSGPVFRLAIPESAETAALAKANHGVVNLLVDLTNGTQTTTLSVPTRTTGMTAAGISSAIWQPHKGASVTKILGMRRPWAVPAAVRAAVGQKPIFCVDGGTIATAKDQVTRIGELHVASQTGVRGTYSYSVQADSNMSIGTSATLNGTYSAGGSVGVDNSIGSGGSDGHTDGWVKYVDDHMTYHHDQMVWDPTGGICGYTIKPVSSEGDVFDGTLSPPSNPWGNCHSAPYIATVNWGGGTWDKLNSTAVTLSWSFSAFGLFDGSGSTGYTTNDGIDYVNNNASNDTYLCGSGGSSGSVAGSPVVYNNPN